MEEPNSPPKDPTDTTPPTDPVDNTPPANPQPAGDPNILAAYQTQLQHEARERARLERELAEARKVKEVPLTPDQEKEFFDKPKSVLKELVRQEIQEAVRPFNQDMAMQRREALIGNLKAQMRKNPAQFPYIDQIEDLFDQIINAAQNIDANVAVAAYNTALGYHISRGGQLTKKVDDTPPPPSNRPTVPNNPPHIRPSAPPPPPAGGKKQIRALTENERKIARFNGQTDEEYLAWSGEMEPHEVAHITDEEVIKRIK